jgi:PAS domain S-box-containing protein
MSSDEREEEELRSVALENAKSIQRARQRAERELIATKQALEARTEELARALAMLREQRQWLEVTLASIGDAVIATDTRGDITFLNPVAERMTGWSSAEALRKPLETVFRIVNEYSRQPASNPVQRVLREGVIVGLANHTALIARNGSSIAIEDSAAPIKGPDGTISGVVMVFRDVTDRRRAEEALRLADRRKDEFLATLAHELRNPLAPIRQAALISKAPGATEAQKRWSHDVIDRQVRHMSLLLDDLLDISRVTRGTLVLKPQPSDLAAMIDAAIETARPTIEAKHHKLSVEIPAEPVRCNADPLRMAQVLSNLLTNAAKYTDPAGQIRLIAARAPHEVIIRVLDNGIGVAPEALPRLFEMFTQIPSARDRSDGGLGIGLALTKALVELHGGSIEAHSGGLGCGSEFVVRLPCDEIVPVRSEPSTAAKQTQASPKRRVLVADDNRDAAETLAALLRIEGHEVLTVHDGPSVLSVLGSFNPDIALLDIGMPGLTGYDLARQIRSEYQASHPLRLVAITGWGQESDKAQAWASGFDAHLTKPVDLSRLLQLLAALGT